MHNIYIDVPHDTLGFLEQVANNAPEFDVYLGGGYLRDKYVDSSISPKDVDIFFIPKDGIAKEVPLATAQGCYVQYHKAASEISDMDDRGVDSLTGLSCSHLTTNLIQFIVYGKYLTQEELVEDMDMGINMIMLKAGDINAMASPKFKEDHASGVIKCYHIYDEERMYYRYERMEATFPEYSIEGKPPAPYSDPVELARHASRYSGSVCLEEE